MIRQETNTVVRNILLDENVASDDDFDYTVSSEHWIGVLEAVKSQNEDELKSRLQEIDDNIRKQELVYS